MKNISVDFLELDHDICPDIDKQYVCKMAKTGDIKLLWCIWFGEAHGCAWGEYEGDWDYDFDDVSHYSSVESIKEKLI